MDIAKLKKPGCSETTRQEKLSSAEMQNFLRMKFTAEHRRTAKQHNTRVCRANRNCDRITGKTYFGHREKITTFLFFFSLLSCRQQQKPVENNAKVEPLDLLLPNNQENYETAIQIDSQNFNPSNNEAEAPIEPQTEVS